MPRLLRLCLFVALVATFACGSSGSVARRAQEIEGQVWSPYCPGRLLIDCTTTQARQLRARIEAELERGASSARVLEGIRRDFGDEALARPPSGRWGLVVWSIPFAIFLVGAVFVAGIVRRRGRQPAPEQAPTIVGDRALKQLREEVEREI